MLIEAVAPSVIPSGRPSIFLAGSIDNGATVDWQKQLAEDHREKNLIFLNPRRANWDKNANEDEITKQIHWELDGLTAADAIIVYFHPKSLAPISLLELGLFARERKVVVVCPPGYWRRTNVQVVCDRFAVPLFDDLNEGMERVIQRAMFNFEQR